MSLEIPKDDLKLLEGVIDMHVHMAPDLPYFNRPYDELSFSKQAREIGYRGILFKGIYAMNADRASMIRNLVPGIDVFGGIVLNWSVGGLNPVAVETAISFGAKCVWMPTFHAQNHIKSRGQPSWERIKVEGISILNSEGNVVESVKEILEMIADADIILATGHISAQESFALLSEARKAGVKKFVVTHPAQEYGKYSIDDQAKIAELGAILEHSFAASMPYLERYDPHLIKESIDKVGADKCVMSTDMGQRFNPHPIDGMRQFILGMSRLGVSESDIRMMTSLNPCKLLGLD